MANEVIALRDGFYAIVDGKMYGPWPMKEYAEAGLATEIRRAERREAESATKEKNDGTRTN